MRGRHRAPIRHRWQILLAGVLATVAACSTPPAVLPRDAPPLTGSAAQSAVATGTNSATAAVPSADHVVVVVMENKNVDQVLGDGNAAFLGQLARTGADFTDAHAETHPSQPNYLALFSGDTQGVTDDSCLRGLAAPNLATQLQAAGRSFVGYSESLPSPGFTGCRSGEYAQKH
jgi:phosphatidylinositol-3-phosphatase